jgi:hypothetical protein
MAPKKKAKAKAKAVEEEPENPEKEELKLLRKQAQVYYLQHKKEDEKFNSFQQQREKLNYFWIVEKVSGVAGMLVMSLVRGWESLQSF